MDEWSVLSFSLYSFSYVGLEHDKFVIHDYIRIKLNYRYHYTYIIDLRIYILIVIVISNIQYNIKIHYI